MKGTHKIIKKLLAKAKQEPPLPKLPPGTVSWLHPTKNVTSISDSRMDFPFFADTREEDYAGTAQYPTGSGKTSLIGEYTKRYREKPIVRIETDENTLEELNSIFSNFKGKF